MGPLALLNHLLNFAAPALVLAGLLALLAPLLLRKRPGLRRSVLVAAINSIAGIAVLAIGLWFFGRDGKMLSYAALVLVCASVQWLALRR